MTNHANCSHPKTKAARAACRRQAAAAPIHVSANAVAEYDDLIALIDEVNRKERFHCTLCGHEVEASADPYTKCCNEPMMPAGDHSECGADHGHS